MQSSTATSAEICAVVVTYHPDPSLARNLEQLQPQVREIVIVDNSTDAESHDLLNGLENSSGFRIIRNQKNLGIAAALNIGIKHAVGAGYKWVATFDQDSSITVDYFSTMLSALASCPFHEEVPLVAPVLCYSNDESDKNRTKGANSVYSLTRTAMTSGSLIRTDIFAKEGFYDESLFMDYVDYEFCLRLWKHGWKLIRANRAHLMHRLGLPETRSFFGREITIKSHNPWRRYYIMRNRMIVFRRYAFSSPRWCVHDFYWIFLELIKILLFEKQKRAQLHETLRGIWHGLSGKQGEPQSAQSA